MTAPSFITVAGPCGSGKTAWISQHLHDQTRPLFYLSPGLGNGSVDLAQVDYRFPWVQVIPENQAHTMLPNLPNDAAVYVELGFHLDLGSPFLGSLPCQYVAVVPPSLETSDWHDWADEIVPGNPIATPDAATCPELWRTSLTGQVFDPPSLDDILIELTKEAYGFVHRVKGIFELPDGRAFYIDFVKGLSGIECTELNLPRWLDGRPERFSGIEVVGWSLEQELIAQTLRDGCLSDEVIAHYQEQYKPFIAGDSETDREKEIFA